MAALRRPRRPKAAPEASAAFKLALEKPHNIAPSATDNYDRYRQEQDRRYKQRLYNEVKEQYKLLKLHAHRAEAVKRKRKAATREVDTLNQLQAHSPIDRTPQLRKRAE